MSRLPTDLSNLLAIAIRDVIWFKDRVLSFLATCGVPPGIMVEVRRMRREGAATLKIVHHVLDRLAAQGDEGDRVAREIMTRMHYWNDLHSVKPDKKDDAVKSLKELREAVKRFQAQDSYRRDQEAREVSMQKQRADRGRLSQLDHAKLQAFRDEFDEVFGIEDRRERGDRFEALMNKVFDYYCEQSKGSFRRIGEQIDGQFYFDKHWYYVEIRWREQQSNAGDISVLRDRAAAAFGGDTKALFISFHGFTDECLASLAGRTHERVVLMDGYDLRCVLDCKIGFDVLLSEKQAEIVRQKDARPFISAREIIARRSQAASRS